MVLRLRTGECLWVPTHVSQCGGFEGRLVGKEALHHLGVAAAWPVDAEEDVVEGFGRILLDGVGLGAKGGVGWSRDRSGGWWWRASARVAVDDVVVDTGHARHFAHVRGPVGVALRWESRERGVERGHGYGPHRVHGLWSRVIVHFGVL